MSTYDNLNEEGYLIVKGVLDQNEIDKLKKDLIQNSIDLVFTQNGFDVDANDPESLQLFVDKKLREEKLGQEASRIVWRNGNTRDPILSKNNGMISIHYNKTLLEIITLNPKLYNHASKILGTDKLVHSEGPERFSIKVKGSVDMPQHIDSNLFVEKSNYPFRIQSLVTLSVGKDVNPRDSGTISIVTHFHLYWKFAGELFHPKTGLFPFSDVKTRFLALPTGSKDFDKYYLPLLKEHAKKYYDGEENSFYDSLRKRNITVPKPEDEHLKWKPIEMEPGDMLFWHQHLPHRSLRNKSKTPRIVAYYSIFPVEDNWYGTKHQLWTSNQFEKCESYQRVYYDVYPSNPTNKEEIEMLKSTKNIKNTSNISIETDFRMKISGQKSW